MSTQVRFARRPILGAVTLVALGLAVLGGTALAGHLPGTVTSYTGCLAVGGGTLSAIKEGNTPLKPCPTGTVEAHFSGGDITSIAVGPGLTGGGTSGALSIGLDGAFSLPQGCANGQLAKWNGSGWACAADNDTTYQAGTGLDLIGTTFSVEPDAFVKKSQSCAEGLFATGADSGGNLACAAPAPAATAGIEVWEKSAAPSPVGVPEVGIDLITLPLPAGTFLLTAAATFGDVTGGAGDEEVSVSCSLLDAGNNELVNTFFNGPDIGSESGINGPRGDLTIHGVATLPAAGPVRFRCFGGGTDEAHGANLTAVRVGTLHRP
jgi:hypothetical protein